MIVPQRGVLLMIKIEQVERVGGRLNREGIYVSVQFSSVAQSYPTLCYPMECSTPGLPVHR